MAAYHTPRVPDAQTLALVTRRYGYDADTGIVKILAPRRAQAPKKRHANRYMKTSMQTPVGLRHFREHHIAWFLHFGVWPTSELDHINRVRCDNRIANLREATRADNNRNCARIELATYATYLARLDKWQVMVGKHYVGVYATQQQATEQAREYVRNLNQREPS